jgi:hypothetical protein
MNLTASGTPKLMAAVTLLLGLFAASSADAACAAGGQTFAGAKPFSTPGQPFFQLSEPDAVFQNVATTEPTIVGLWKSTLTASGGQNCEEFAQWFADGNDVSVGSAVPAFGNVSTGTWKRVGPLTYRLRRVSWTWSFGGFLTGTLTLLETLRLSSNGNAFFGTFTAFSFDADGNAGQQLSGTINATRITVE